MNYYDILGISKTATQDEIKKAYRKLAQKYHPDRNKAADAEQKFKDIQTAYNTLKDVSKRAAYDNPQTNNFSFRSGDFYRGNPNINISGFDGLDLDDILEALNARRWQQQRPTAKIVISLEEAYHGTTRSLNNKEFQVPRGVRTGNKLSVDEFIIVVQVQPHINFKRINDDLYTTAEITATEAMIGVDCNITGLDGKVVKFKIPAGTQYGQTIRLKGKGMPNPEIQYKGDLLIQVSVKIPDNLTEDQKEHIMKLPRRESIDI